MTEREATNNLVLESEPPQSFISGLSIPGTEYEENAAKLLQVARADGYDFCVTALALPSSDGNVDDVGMSVNRSAVRTDLCDLASTWWSTSIIGSLTFPRDVQPVSDNCFGINSEEGAIFRKVRWACHMNIPAIIISLSGDLDFSLLTRISLISSAHNLQIWIRRRLTWSDIDEMDLILRHCSNGSGGSNIGVCLEMLNVGNYNVSQMCQMLHVVLGMNLRAISFDTKSFMTNKRGFPTLSKTTQSGLTYVLQRLGGTLRILVEGPPSHTPISNSGLPVQGKQSIALIGESGCLPYLQYLRHLRQRQEVTSILDSREASMEANYLDHLQSPLQPLGDDLEYATYETFEKDPVKYAQYELAIFEALTALMAGKRLEQISADSCPVFHTTIFVLGAGRGPLVQRALNAVQKVQKLSMYGKLVAKVVAIEKNTNAIMFLKSMLQSHERASRSGITGSENARWSSQSVQIIQCDMRFASENQYMRKWQNDVLTGRDSKVDILVSELLGSFGDNELSPECLEGAITALNKMNLLRDHCISIPQTYTSYLAPVSSVRLHAEAKAQSYATPSSAMDGPLGQPFGALKAMETPYVVRPHAASQTHSEKPVFMFDHVAFGGRQYQTTERIQRSLFNKKNVIVFDGNDAHFSYEIGSGYKRRTSIERQSSVAPGHGSGVTIHGLLGSFEAKLFGNITISIRPSSFSVGMFSWFPLYFPLKDPLYVPSGASIIASMWRRYDEPTSRVWYEWGVDIAMTRDKDTMSDLSMSQSQIISCSPIHNPGGRSYHVKL